MATFAESTLLDIEVKMRDRSESYRFVAIDPSVADEYRESGAGRVVVADSSPGFPCRQCLRDAEVGEELILVPHLPFDGSSPYTGPTAIFIHRTPCEPRAAAAEVPRMLRHRTLSLRGFDGADMMRAAAVIEGNELESAIRRILEEPSVDYVEVHNAAPGCWNCRVERD